MKGALGILFVSFRPVAQRETTGRRVKKVAVGGGEVGRRSVEWKKQDKNPAPGTFGGIQPLVLSLPLLTRNCCPKIAFEI